MSERDEAVVRKEAMVKQTEAPDPERETTFWWTRTPSYTGARGHHLQNIHRDGTRIAVSRSPIRVHHPHGGVVQPPLRHKRTLDNTTYDTWLNTHHTHHTRG